MSVRGRDHDVGERVLGRVVVVRVELRDHGLGHASRHERNVGRDERHSIGGRRVGDHEAAREDAQLDAVRDLLDVGHAHHVRCRQRASPDANVSPSSWWWRRRKGREETDLQQQGP